MTYTKDQFLDDVKAEAKALREHATKEELGRLDAVLLLPHDVDACIYGLACGNCNNPRAIELIQKCCRRYFDNVLMLIEGGGFSVISECKSTESVEDFEEKREDFGIEYISSIEAYVAMPEASITNLIAYLRSETDDLNL